MRTYQRVSAKNGFEAAMNKVVYEIAVRTAVIWVPLCVLYMGWLWAFGKSEPNAPITWDKAPLVAPKSVTDHKPPAGVKIIELPDGSEAEFPAFMDDAAIEAVLQKQFPPKQPAKKVPNTRPKTTSF